MEKLAAGPRPVAVRVRVSISGAETSDVARGLPARVDEEDEARIGGARNIRVKRLSDSAWNVWSKVNGMRR